MLKKIFFSLLFLIFSLWGFSCVSANTGYNLEIQDFYSGIYINHTGFDVEILSKSGNQIVSGQNIFWKINDFSGFVQTSSTGYYDLFLTGNIGSNEINLLRYTGNITDLSNFDFTSNVLFSTSFVVYIDVQKPVVLPSAMVHDNTITWTLNLSELSYCIFSNSLLTGINQVGDSYKTEWNTGITYSDIGLKKIYFACSDKAGNYITGDFESQISFKGIKILSPEPNGLYSGYVHFEWTLIDTGQVAKLYKLIVDNNQDFSSPVLEISTENNFANESISNTGKYYFKIYVETTSGYSGYSTTGIFWINEISGDNIPTKFILNDEFSGSDYFVGDWIPLKIYAYKNETLLTGFSGYIIFDYTGTSSDVILPDPVFFDNTGMVYLWHKVKFLKEGDYILKVCHNLYKIICGEKTFHIKNRDKIGFQFLDNVKKSTWYKSNVWEFTGNANLKVDNGYLYINGNDRGNYYNVEEGDEVQIKLLSPSDDNKCEYSILYSGYQKIAAFGVCTNFDEFNVRQNLDLKTKILLFKKINYLFKKYLLKGYNLKLLKTEILKILDKKVFISNQESLYSQSLFLRKLSSFKYILYKYLYEVVENYDVNIKKTFENDYIYFEYPFDWKGKFISDGLIIEYNGKKILTFLYFSGTDLETKVKFYRKIFDNILGQVDSNGWKFYNYSLFNFEQNGLTGKSFILYYKKGSLTRSQIIKFYSNHNVVFMFNYENLDYKDYKKGFDELFSSLKFKN